jgi:ligand-binding SRPBCC domain-containing protein
MPVIQLDTVVDASPQRCFDLARDVELHQRSTATSHERAVAGVTSGRVALGDEVTWEAVHFGLRLRLTSRITTFDPPHEFVDEMVRGPFRRITHIHRFVPEGNGTRMIDVFDYTAPLGPLGRLADAVFLRRYMTSFLRQRNAYLKQVAEKEVLP